MTGKHVLIGVGIAVSLAILTSGAAKSAADKYTLKVPDGLAFAEFRGYEAWQTIAVSQNGGLFAVILGNPVMINAYKTGVPGNGKPFPDGARMAKIHWQPKKQETEPGQPTVSGTLHDVDFMVKDTKRFADSGGWGWAALNTTPHPASSGLPCSDQPRRQRRQVRIRVSHDSEEPRLCFHGIWQQVTCVAASSAMPSCRQTGAPHREGAHEHSSGPV